MPLDGNDVASAPAGSTATPNTTIESAKYNALFGDIYSILNTVRTIAKGFTGATTAIGALDNFHTKSSNIASASTVDLSAATGDLVHITGTTAITAFSTQTAGNERTIVFDGALTLTHNATSLILPGGENIVTAAGDTAVMRSEGGGNWKCTHYQSASGAVLYAPQSRTPALQAQARSNISAALKGHIYGLTLSNNGSDANNDIDIAAGEAASDDSDPVLMVLSSAITKRLDASWAVGTGNGGLDTGSKANSTWYYVWLIRRSDTGVVDVLFSTSATSPTMPTNYDQKRRLPGAIRTDGSGNIIAFIMSGRRITWKAIPGTAEYGSGALGTTAVTSTPSFVPTAFKVRAFYNASALFGSSNAVVLITDPDTDDVAPDGDGNSPLASIVATSAFRMTINSQVFTSATGTIRLRANAANVTILLIVYAWEDYLA